MTNELPIQESIILGQALNLCHAELIGKKLDFKTIEEENHYLEQQTIERFVPLIKKVKAAYLDKYQKIADELLKSIEAKKMKELMQ